MWGWNKEDVKPWLKEVFRAFGETAYTSDFLAETERILEKSDSIVTFLLNCFPSGLQMKV